MISLKSDEIVRYVMFKLNKDVNEFSEEELNMIDELTINGNDRNVDFAELRNFKNLEDLLISNMFLSKSDVLILQKLPLLRALHFNKCFFEDVSIISTFNINELDFVDCDIIDYSFIKNISGLKKLSIVNGGVSLIDLKNLSELVFLRLSHSEIDDLGDFDFPMLEELYINNTNINNSDFLNNLNNLKVIDLSSEQCDNWRNYVDTLYKKKVLVLKEGIPFNNDRG